MARKNRSADSTRSDIIEAAAAVFSRDGFEGASVREIARIAGVSQGTLYYHIGSKSQVLLELHDTFANDMIDRLRMARESHKSPVDQLRAFIDEMMITVEIRGERMGLFLRERRYLPEEAREHMREKSDEIDEILRGILEDGARECLWRGDSLTSTRMAIFGMVSWAMEWFDPSASRRAVDFAGDFFRLVLTGISLDRDSAGSDDETDGGA